MSSDSGSCSSSSSSESSYSVVLQHLDDVPSQRYPTAGRVSFEQHQLPRQQQQQLRPAKRLRQRLRMSDDGSWSSGSYSSLPHSPRHHRVIGRRNGVPYRGRREESPDEIPIYNGYGYGHGIVHRSGDGCHRDHLLVDRADVRRAEPLQRRPEPWSVDETRMVEMPGSFLAVYLDPVPVDDIGNTQPPRYIQETSPPPQTGSGVPLSFSMSRSEGCDAGELASIVSPGRPSRREEGDRLAELRLQQLRTNGYLSPRIVDRLEAKSKVMPSTLIPVHEPASEPIESSSRYDSGRSDLTETLSSSTVNSQPLTSSALKAHDWHSHSQHDALMVPSSASPKQQLRRERRSVQFASPISMGQEFEQGDEPALIQPPDHEVVKRQQASTRTPT